jgi:aldehyde:ferredoxin oxidoreductase
MEDQIMPDDKLAGYTGQILRVDLSAGSYGIEPIPESRLRKYMGGAALGIRTVFEEVPDGTAWDAPQNIIFLGSGPLGGTRIGGSGSLAVVTKGALTNGMASSQANGYFGAYLKFAGYDAIILQGMSPAWCYLYINNDRIEIRPASHLLNKTTVEVDSMLQQELGKTAREISVLSIGPAGENLVRFACLVTDQGHVAAHNGVGAVMGSKKVKAIVLERSGNRFYIKDAPTLSSISKQLLENMKVARPRPYVEGTVGGVLMATSNGSLAIRNYTTSINTMLPQTLETYSYQNVRSRFEAKPTPCWACSARHCHSMKVNTGKYAGRSIEEPEYEGMAAFSSLAGIDDVTSTVVLASEVDRLGMDINETGWVISWLLECYEKRLITKEHTDGLEMTWGNAENIIMMLNRIARREGFGNVLAEGVMRAAQQIGPPAQVMAIHTKKGNTPRTHDHRAMWLEMFDTCVSNLGTLEAHLSAPLKQLGLPEYYDPFDPMAVSTVDAKIKGAMVFEDSMVTCRFNTATNLELMCRAVNAATGWNIDIGEAMKVGKRAVNLARVFNLRQGIKAELDAPSLRYGSTPLDGIAAGVGILPHWHEMLVNYYHNMGWGEKTGCPLPETLKSLDLDDVIDLLPAPENENTG